MAWQERMGSAKEGRERDRERNCDGDPGEDEEKRGKRGVGKTDIVPVLLPVAVERPYSYRVPAGMVVAPGDIVAVPLGTQRRIGVVWDGAGEEVAPGRLRDILETFDCPAIPERMRRFLDWVADWTISPPGMVLRMTLRAPEALVPPKPARGVRVTGVAPQRMTAARARVLEAAGQGMAWLKRALAEAAGVSAGVIDGLVAQGALEEVDLPVPRLVPLPDPDHAPPQLTPAQAEAAEELRKAVRCGNFSVTLLDGVTGSGKTEVYFEAIAAAVAMGRQVLVLLPEISLTGEFLDRFVGRFGSRPAEWHSDISAAMRNRVWRGVITGEIRVVVGARSALFLPFPELGLIVIDEEHDLAYKQEERVIYNARDMAVVRGHLAGFPVVLASATPSVESRNNADRGRYRRIVLPERFTRSGVPRIKAIDLRRDPPERGRFLAPQLVAEMRRTLAAGEQVLIFLNRRGYAPLTLCRRCGHRFRCPNCSAWLVEHRFRGTLACHHCGHEVRRPDTCPKCGAEDSLVACGPGVERVAEEVAARFADARVLVLSSDLAGGVRRLREELAAVARGEFQIIIGTQLVAKGHNFPELTLVGVVDADIGLTSGDPRAAERTFQLLSQVTGRAGRAGQEGCGLVQTHASEHPVIEALVAGDRERFYRYEIAERRAARLPPFARLASVIVSARDRGAAERHARALARTAPTAKGFSVLGPAEAPLALVRGRHRFRLLVQAALDVDMQGLVRAWLAAAPAPRGSIRVSVDVDPQSFL